MKCEVLRNVTQCWRAKISTRSSWTVDPEYEVLSPSETSGTTSLATRRHSRKYVILQQHRFDNLKSRKFASPPPFVLISQVHGTISHDFLAMSVLFPSERRT